MVDPEVKLLTPVISNDTQSRIFSAAGAQFMHEFSLWDVQDFAASS